MQRDKYSAVIVGGAIGDALGWPFEFPESARKHAQLRNGAFLNWTKAAGGSYWGYNDEIHAGDYSDDTQLTLSVGRSIDFQGRFLIDRFAYEELPLWLQYERGGGRATKYAVNSLLSRKQVGWRDNFFRVGKTAYRDAGANGAAMRCAPIVLANINNNLSTIAKYLNENTISTHGHPRAIIGCYLIAAALISALKESPNPLDCIKEVANDLADKGLQHISAELPDWLYIWNQEGKSFTDIFSDVIEEMNDGLDAIKKYKSLSECVRYFRADQFSNKGSGISSTLTAIASYVINGEAGSLALEETAYYPGIDTDTVSSMVGWLLGARYGRSVFHEEWLKNVQDSHYLSRMGENLHGIAFPEIESNNITFKPMHLSKRDYLSRVWAWEIGMFEMFWDAIDVGSVMNHPTLGQGKVIKKVRNDVAYEAAGKPKYYDANVVIKFIEGQTCSFHSVINDNGLPESGLIKRLEKILK
ncbi:ADP-ribosylglycohydrolase family protein [Deinococcus caeni]|uniref:ADP-ribosylglycohydrolase n=1 Tax=Deinococcus caeni TaxID=569127 RepID=A0ABP9UG66_9DEIO